MVKPTIIITGANGFIGSALVEHFSQKGWNVIALGFGQTLPASKKNITYIGFRLGIAPDKEIFKHADYLIHAAYMKHDKDHSDAYNLNILGASQLLNLAKKYHLKQYIFISSMSAQPDAQSSYGRQKYEIELMFSRQGGTNLRLGMVVGQAGLLMQTIKLMKKSFVIPLIGGGKQPVQTVALYDLIKVFDQVVSRRLKGTYTIAHPKAYTYKELYQVIGQIFKMRRVFVPAPYWIFQTLFKAVQFLRIPLPINEDNLLGLKKLRYKDTTSDLAIIGTTLDSLETCLNKLQLS